MPGGQTWDELPGRQVIAAALGEIVCGAARTDTFLAKRYKRQNACSLLDRSGELLLDLCREHNLAWGAVLPPGSAFLGVAKVTEPPAVLAAATALDATPAQVGPGLTPGPRPTYVLVIPGDLRLAHLADNIATLAGHVTEFAKILTGRHGEQPDTWITAVDAARLICKVTDAVNEELAARRNCPPDRICPGAGEIWRPALPGSDLLRHGAGDAGPGDAPRRMPGHAGARVATRCCCVRATASSARPRPR